MVDYRNEGHGEKFTSHSHHEYEIYFFHSGSVKYLIHNHIYDLEPGDILLMDGMALHRPNVSPESVYIRSTVHFSPQWIIGVLKELNSLYLLDAFQKLHHCIIRTSQSSELRQLERISCRLEQVKRSTNPSDVHAETEMKVLLIEALIIVNRLVKLDAKKSDSSKLEKAEHAENIAAYIQEHYSDKLTLESIAESLNISKSYLSHVFKEMTGFTVMEYVMGCRLRQVKYLLEINPTKPLKEVSQESGFESVSHFSRYFKEKVGVTAKEYRRSRLKRNR